MPTLILPSLSGTLCTDRLKEWQPLEAASLWIGGKWVTAMSAKQEIVNLTSPDCANNVSLTYVMDTDHALRDGDEDLVLRDDVDLSDGPLAEVLV